MNFRHLILLVLVLNCEGHQFGRMRSLRRLQANDHTAIYCYNSTQFVAALANDNVTDILLQTDVTLADGDFTAYRPLITLHRSVNIQGPESNRLEWPWSFKVLDMGFVSAKVVLMPGVTFAFRRLAIRGYRQWPHFQAGGLDIVIRRNSSLVGASDSEGAASGGEHPPAPPSSAGGDATLPPALMYFEDVALLQRTCLPPSLYMASSNSLVRPTELPGKQRADRLPAIRTTNCSNSTAAPPLQRCYPAWGMYTDIATYAGDMEKGQQPVPNGYLVSVINTYYICGTVMAENCSQAFGGPVGCFYHMFKDSEDPQPPPPPPNHPAIVLLGSDGADGGGGGGDGGGGSGILGPVLGGVLGGVAGLAAAAAAVWVLVARRRKTRGGARKDGSRTAGSAVGRDASSDGRLSCVEAANSHTAGDVRAKGMRSDGSAELQVPGTSVTAGGEVVITTDPCGPGEQPADPPPRQRLLQPSAAKQGADRNLTSHSTTSNSASYGGHLASSQLASNEPELVIVTQLTPLLPGINLAVKLCSDAERAPSGQEGAVSGDGADVGGGDVELKLLPTVLGKGSYGCVVEGLYGGTRVAVKVLRKGFGVGNVSGGAVPAAATATATAAGAPASEGISSKWSSAIDHDRAAAAATAETVAAAAAPVSSGAGSPDGGGPKNGLTAVEAEVAVKPPAEAAGGEAAAGAGLLPSSAVYTAQDATGCGGGTDKDPAAQQEQEQAGSVMQGEMSKPAKMALAREVEVLARCQHPNVVRLLAASLRPPHMCLVMELMDTSLERLLYGRPDRHLLPLQTVLHIGIHVSRALSYLHPTVLHRDLKPANVLIQHPDSPKPVAKLADFGLSRLLHTVLVTQHPEAGTTPYMAPEAFDITNNVITDRADIYAVGVLLWEMLAGRRPWEGFTNMQIAYAVTLMRSRLPLQEVPADRCPMALRSLIVECWDPDPARRPAAAEIVKTLSMLQKELGGDAPNEDE